MTEAESERCSILIADDDVDLCASLRDVLELEAWEVDVVHAGAAALDAVGVKDYDGLLLDIHLPDLAGTELLAQLEEAAPELEVLVITGQASLESAVEAVSPSTVGYLVKPLDFDRLFRLLAGIRKRRRTRRENRQLVAHLEEKYAELERYTYTVSHDLKSPLMTISGFAKLIERNVRDGNLETLRRDTEHVEKAVQHMARLLDDLLEHSRVGRVLHAVESVSLADLIEDVLRLLDGQLSERAIEVVIGEGLPTVRADRVRLRQALQNLIDNAVKFMGEQAAPRIEIGVCRRDELDLCFIRDNGVGIEPRYLDRVFGLFDQLDPSTGGTGIGLALSRRIIESHRGCLWVESEGTGQGSCFYFTLPAA